MFKLNYIILAMLFCYNLYSQTAENYCEQWVNQKDTITDRNTIIKLSHKLSSKVNALCKTEIWAEVGHIFRNTQRLDSALYYYDKAIKEGQRINAEEQLGHLYNSKAYIYIVTSKKKEALPLLKKSREKLKLFPDSEHWVVYYQTYAYLADLESNYEEAITFTDSAITISERHKNVNYLYTSYLNKGVYYMRLTDYDNSIENYIKAIEVVENDGSTSGLDASYHMLAVSYSRLKQYETASKYFRKSISYSRQTGNNYFLFLNYSRMANSLKNNKEYIKAMSAIDSSIVLATKLKDNTSIADGFLTKADIYFDGLKQYDEAEKYYTKAYNTILNANLDKQRDFVITNSLQGLVKNYLHKEQYSRAKHYLTALEKESKRTNVLVHNKTYYKLSSEYYEKTGNSILALKHYKKYVSIKDSTDNKDVKTKLANLEKKYDINKKELEIATLNQKNEVQKQLTSKAKLRQHIFLLLAILLILLLLGGTWLFLKIKKQRLNLSIANNKLSEINNVKNRLFSIIAHDLKGMIIPFQRAGKIIKFHIDKGDYQHTIKLSQELQNNSEHLSNMLDNILKWSLEQMNGYSYKPTEISLKEDLQNILIGFEEQAKSKNTIIELNYEEDVVILFDKGAFHVIFRNLIGNALKYTEEGTIKVNFSNDFNTLICSVTDTGLGMTELQLQEAFSIKDNKTTIGTQGEKGTGIGLNLVHQFVKMQKGTITVFSENRMGTRFELRFPNIAILDKNDSNQLKPHSA